MSSSPVILLFLSLSSSLFLCFSLFLFQFSSGLSSFLESSSWMESTTGEYFAASVSFQVILLTTIFCFSFLSFTSLGHRSMVIHFSSDWTSNDEDDGLLSVKETKSITRRRRQMKGKCKMMKCILTVTLFSDTRFASLFSLHESEKEGNLRKTRSIFEETKRMWMKETCSINWEQMDQEKERVLWGRIRCTLWKRKTRDK